MSENKAARLRLIYGICLSVLLVTVGACFAVSCYLIYKSGARPFSPESVGVHFKRIAAPVFLCVAAVLVGGVIELSLPAEQKKLKALPLSEDLLKRARRADAYPAELLARIKRERQLRLALRLATAVIWIGCALPALIYLLNPASFPNEALTAEVIAAVLLSLPLAVVAILLSTLASLLIDGSIRREIQLHREARSVPADADVLPLDRQEGLVLRLRQWAEANNEGITLGLRIGLPVIALVLLLLGILGGDAQDVLAKAIAICTECIGLG